jgi:hypothetical protein
MDNNAATQLYDLLVTRDFEPEILDASGRPVTNPDDAELLSFDWKTENKNYGTVVVLLGKDNELEVYFGDNLGRTMEEADKSEWYNFLQQLKQFAARNLLTFNINNLNRLKYTMQGMAAIKEGLFEGYYGTRKVSYSDRPEKTRLVIKHKRDLGEGEARHHAIDTLFVETADGERFRVPSRSLMHGKMIARHVSEGGNPYDAFGQHINDVVNEINTLSKFVRAARSKQFGEDATDMIESAVRHYTDLKNKAKRMISQRGYHEEREQFDPALVTDSEQMVDEIRNMFIEQNLDYRIEQALPILARLNNSATKMREVEEFESWTDEVNEGTWALPDTPEKQRKLDDILAKELTVGPDATNAEEQLYDLVGDDQLFDQLQDAAQNNPDADVRDIVIARLKQLGQQVSEPEVAEDIDTDGVMMTRASNMSNENRDIDSLRRIVELAKK